MCDNDNNVIHTECIEIQKKATKSKGKGSRRSRGLIKLRKGHPYMHSPTSVVSYNYVVAGIIKLSSCDIVQ